MHAHIMAAWDYSNSTDILGSDARRGALVFIPDDSLSANAQGTEAPGRVAVEYGQLVTSPAAGSDRLLLRCGCGV
ncbi:hypothetical protein E3G56_005171 [Mycobacteroides abscessus]|nr:hypothetical protein [Mycobacteroides abscessus]